MRKGGLSNPFKFLKFVILEIRETLKALKPLKAVKCTQNQLRGVGLALVFREFNAVLFSEFNISDTLKFDLRTRMR